MKSIVNLFNHKTLLIILLFGTLIGFNETVIGSIKMPYRSVILSSITILLLTIARLKKPLPFSSVFIILIAILYKINNLGIYSCSTSTLLCGPTALLILGITFELSAFIFSKSNSSYTYYYTISSTAVSSFLLFGTMNTYILHLWESTRFIEYTLLKGPLTAITASLLFMLASYSEMVFRSEQYKLKPWLINGIIGITIICLWVAGTIVTV